ncbi:hypothetical protein CU097_007649 [Rhizopus azygosporus]|uniref:Uncharacterized protein n=1 Tax=Rhizopus azygosporus TaxID=86630 RepID=A0A367J4X1_RHIAZ|nr:hypothetical protein CU097_007649 [Rhizopus azygosporus]
MSKASIEPHLKYNGSMYLMIALIMFMTFSERCLMSLDRWDDATIQKLYSTAREICNDKQNIDRKSLVTLQVISEVHQRQYTKIKDYLLKAPLDISKSTYSGRLKREYEAALHEEDHHEESVTTIEEPPNIPSSSTCTVDTSAMQFVEAYIEKSNGRSMDWKHGFNTDVEQGFIKGYATKESLRVMYSRYKKRK